jgi:hypothetical protein
LAGVKLWFDEEGDFLEVTFGERAGHLREIAPDVYERVDQDGRMLGFAVFNFSKRDRSPLDLPLELSGRLSA